MDYNVAVWLSLMMDESIKEEILSCIGHNVIQWHIRSNLKQRIWGQIFINTIKFSVIFHSFEWTTMAALCTLLINENINTGTLKCCAHYQLRFKLGDSIKVQQMTI